MTGPADFGDLEEARTLRERLREKFPPEQVGRIPAGQGRPALDFVGHAAVVDRLNRYAPDWTYEIRERFVVGKDCWVYGTITIGGISRDEYGDGKDPKEAIGNFIRRGAMRFGVALDLWSREELDSGATEAAMVHTSPSSVSKPSVADSPSSAEGAPISEGTGREVAPGVENPVSSETSGGGSEAFGEGVTGSPSVEAPGEVEVTEAGASASPVELWIEARELIGNTGQVVKFAAKVLGKTVSSSTLTAEDLTAVIAAKRGEAA